MGPLRAAHLVRARISEGGPQLETYHDRIRKAVVGTLSADELRAHHLQLARAWEQSGCADPQTLAQHWLEAGYGERAAAFAAEAAAQAAEALAFDRAARLYRLALELSTASGDERRILRTRLGDALSEAGRGSEAAEAYLSAVEGASIADGLELRRRASEQLLISGHIDRGLAVLRDVLGMMGMRLARTPERALAAQVVRRAQLRVRGLTYRERASDVLDADVLRHIDMCWSVTIGLSMVDTIRGTHFQSRHILAALRAGEPYRICRALAFEVSGSVVRGKRSVRRTEKLLQTGWALARRIDDPHALGLMAVANASAASFHGRFREALEMCERADTLLRDHCTGVVWELDTNEIFRLHSYCWMGRWKELSFRLPSLLREAREREDLYLATYLGSRSFYTVHLAADHVAEAREGQRSSIAAWSSQGFQVQHYWDWLACTEIDLYDERADVAWRRIEERWRAYLRSALHLNQALYIESLSLRARAALALAATHSDPNAHSDARKLLRTAARDAKRMSSQERPWGNALADLLRAGISATQGDAQTAATLAHAAEQQFNALDMGLHAAAARRRRGRLLGGAEGHSLAESAAAWMSEEGIKNPGRVTAMLIPGRWG
ncbi:MAG: hypothetical protein JRE70_21830 [Deltaproteobacteria bacterium]|nr:hypothetical protein [Deltaproteobacteria bacterium]